MTRQLTYSEAAKLAADRGVTGRRVTEPLAAFHARYSPSVEVALETFWTLRALTPDQWNALEEVGQMQGGATGDLARQLRSLHDALLATR